MERSTIHFDSKTSLRSENGITVSIITAAAEIDDMSGKIILANGSDTDFPTQLGFWT